MGDLLRETIAGLAWNVEGMPFELPQGAVAWKLRLHTGRPGRPGVVWSDDGIVHIPLDAGMPELRRAVDNEPGSYRLYPVDADGKELEPVAVIEVLPPRGAKESTGLAVADNRASHVPSAMSSELPLRFFDLYEKMIASRDNHDELMTRVVSTLVTTTAGIQQSTAGLLESASTTIRVANGVEALDRVEAPQLDIEGLTDKLAVVGQLKQTISSLGDSDRKQGTPWVVQLLNGPVGASLMSIASNFAQSIVTAHQQAAKQQAAEQPQTPRNANGAGNGAASQNGNDNQNDTNAEQE